MKTSLSRALLALPMAALALSLSQCSKTADEPEPVPPAVMTGAVSDTTITSAKVAGSVTNLGSGAVTAFGHVWSETNAQPSTADNKAITTGTSSAFTSELSGLQPGKAYNVRAYATNAAGTTYGQAVQVGTVKLRAVQLSMIGASNVSGTGARVGFRLSDLGNAAVSEYGVLYSTTAALPELSSGTKVLSTGTPSTGEAYAELTGLTVGTAYNVRAFATTQYGTVYAPTAVKFNTPQLGVVAINSTVPGFTLATVSIKITALGNPAAYEYGLVYSTTSQTPTVDAPSVKVKYTGSPALTNALALNLPGLTSNTTYSLRAYLLSSSGVAYSETATLKTLDAQVAYSVESATPLAGKDGVQGETDGSGPNATLAPFRLTVDPADGKIYFVNRRTGETGGLIRSLTTGGEVKTLTTNKTSGCNNVGTASQVRMNGPTGLSMDTEGRLWVAVEDCNDLYIFNSKDNFSATKFGKFIANVQDVVILADGSIYADYNSTWFYRYADLTSTNAEIVVRYPSGIGLITAIAVSADGNNFYFASASKVYRVAKIAPTVLLTLAGNSSTAGDEDNFSNIQGLALDKDGSTLFVTDASASNGRVAAINIAAAKTKTLHKQNRLYDVALSKDGNSLFVNDLYRVFELKLKK